MKDKINKIRDDAYYQYGFYIGYAIANRILSESLPGKDFDLKKKENLSKIEDHCFNTVSSGNSMMKFLSSFKKNNNEKLYSQVGEIFKIYDMLSFEYLKEEKTNKKFLVKNMLNFTFGFLEGISAAISKINDFIYFFFNLEDLFGSKNSADLLVACYPVMIAIISQQRISMKENLEKEPSLAPVLKFIQEKEVFLRHFNIDKETGFASLDIEYECQIPNKYYIYKNAQLNKIKNKISLLFHFLP